MKSQLFIAFLLCVLFSCNEKQKPRVLVFSKTMGYRHESIGMGKMAMIDLGKKNGFEVDTTEDASLFNGNNLKRYSAVLFLCTTLDVLDIPQQSDFKRFIQAGGGYVGIHAAADTEYEWPWYGKLVGAYFKSHPKIQEAKFRKVKPDDLTQNLPDEWIRTDELYNYKSISDDIEVLYTLDETTYEGGENGDYHPIAWYHNFDGGRAFYTGMGHTKESYADSLYLNHVLQGIKYAIGTNSLDYSKAYTKQAPEENRFNKVVLDFNLNEPTEMTILPDNNILFVERKGQVKIYDQQTKKIDIVATIPVSTKYTKDKEGKEKDAEDGLLGTAVDPKFNENHWIYFYYSPLGSDPKNILVRYTLNGKKLDESSKKIVLEVPVQRDQCCHTGGSIAFDAHGNLFLSTGDNTNPFESNGYSPSDEQPGRSPFDAQKSSSNTNDLRGKILRIHPEPDGTYTIPEGNLFPKGEEKTRPEIYVMGNRNPYRISIDQKTNYLYWGEVGPDAGTNDSLLGPRGYDEVNQAKKPGFFGWPYFVGKNYAYAKYDFEAKKISANWDPLRPNNSSPNNTGKQELPAVSAPFIWYPYSKSDDFPMLKEGGRTAMAGPVYYMENYKGVASAFPDYFDGKLIIYEWMRNWMFLVSMDIEGKIVDIEPFMPNTKFNNIIDMSFGTDGKLYMIEYGTVWQKQNLDARLVRIDYNGGNRPPSVQLSADRLSGALPFAVKFTSAGTLDYDAGDELKFELEVAGKTYSSPDGNFSVSFDKPGVFKPTLKVTDNRGASSTAQLQLIAGNEAPTLKAEITGGNKTFFFPKTPVNYAVQVTDKEDGSSNDGNISSDLVKVTFDYLKGFDRISIAPGHQLLSAELPGKALIEKSDCKSCHLIDAKSAGPGFIDVASKYKTQKGAIDYLTAKVIRGGAGVWGTTEMAAHPQVSVEDASKMVEYILSLAEKKIIKRLPLKGSFIPEEKKEGVYILSASYEDKAVNSLPSLSATDVVVLRTPVLNADDATELNRATLGNQDGIQYLKGIKNGSYAVFASIDLTTIKSFSPMVFIDGDVVEGEIELHLDSVDGKLLGKNNFKNARRTVVSEDVVMMESKIRADPAVGIHNLYVVFKNQSAGDKTLFYFGQLKLSDK